jgi:hypothetical protein
MAPSALLFVLSDPGTGVTEEEFHDWYDNEHIPLRFEIPAFLNWTRLKAADGRKPGWAQIYDLTSYEEMLKPPYSTLAETRSEREKGVLRNMEVLERGTYEAYEGNERLPQPSAHYDPKRYAPYVQIASVDVKPEGEAEFHRWYDEEHIAKITTIPGWVRSRRFVLRDWTRGGVEGSNDKTPVMKWLAVHEYTNLDWLNNPKEDGKFVNEWTKKVTSEIMTRRELRVFSFYKSWERK